MISLAIFSYCLSLPLECKLHEVKNFYLFFPICRCLAATQCPTPATPRTAAHQAPLSMGFPRQECLSGLPLPSPGDLPSSGIKSASPALAGEFFTIEPLGKPIYLPVNTL